MPRKAAPKAKPESVMVESNDHRWRVIPNFDQQSRLGGRSSASGQVKREDDPGVIRCTSAYIEDEGFFDLTFYDAEQLALLIGYISPGHKEELEERIAALEAELTTAKERHRSEVRDALETLWADL